MYNCFMFISSIQRKKMDFKIKTSSKNQIKVAKQEGVQVVLSLKWMHVCWKWLRNTSLLTQRRGNKLFSLSKN